MKWSSTLLVAVSLLPATPVSAQTTISLMGGLNTASIDLETDAHPASSIQPVTRMSVGLAATFPTSERFGIQLGGTYSQKGGGLEAQEDGATISSSIKFDYIEVTLLARMRFPLSGERVTAHLLAGPALGLQSSCQLAMSMPPFPLSGERVTAHLLAGPALGLQSSCQLAMSGRQGTVEVTSSSSCDEHYLVAKDYDIGLAGGGGIGIGLTDQLQVTLGLLYTHGLSNIDDTGSAGTLRNRALTLRAGFDFPIG